MAVMGRSLLLLVGQKWEDYQNESSISQLALSKESGYLIRIPVEMNPIVRCRRSCLLVPGQRSELPG